MIEKTKIAFLFGAGAEGKGNFDMPSGLEYMKDSIFNVSKEITDCLGEFFNRKKYYYNGSYDYNKNKYLAKKDAPKMLIEQNLFYLIDDENFIKENGKTISLLLGNSSIRNLKDEYNDKISDYIYELSDNEKKEGNEIKNLIQDKLEKILLGEIINFDEIQNPLLEKFFINNNNHIEFRTPLQFGGKLDSYFHTIIDPKKYGKNKFSIIFNYYWACYFSILKGVINFHNKNSIKNKDKFSKYLDYNYPKTISDIHKLTKDLYDEKITISEGSPYEKTYYHLITKYLEENKDNMVCCGILTSNYYKFCESIPTCGDPKDTIAYINGKLNLFEFPEELEVRDFSNGLDNTDTMSNEKLFFPFIFGQSLVKPIVHPLQTKEYNKAHKILEKADVLVIIGYNISEDDNHIKTLLHEYIHNDNKKIIMMYYGAQSPKRIKLNDLLKCNEDKIIEYCFDSKSYKSTDSSQNNNEIIIQDIFDEINKCTMA